MARNYVKKLCYALLLFSSQNMRASQDFLKWWGHHIMISKLIHDTLDDRASNTKSPQRFAPDRPLKGLANQREWCLSSREPAGGEDAAKTPVWGKCGFWWAANLVKQLRTMKYSDTTITILISNELIWDFSLQTKTYWRLKLLFCKLKDCCTLIHTYSFISISCTLVFVPLFLFLLLLIVGIFMISPNHNR